MISIIIPAKNEGKRIEDTLIKYLAYFERSYKDDFEIIVVIDDCLDNTVEICKKYPVTLKFNEQAHGKGYAVKEGFKIAKGSIMCFSDADGATSANELDVLIKATDKYDCAIGNRRYFENLAADRQSNLRRFLSNGYNILVNLLFGLGIQDTQCGAKAFKKEAIDAIIKDWKIGGLAFDVELLYLLKKKKFTIKEIPIVWIDKKNSTVKLKKEVWNMGIAIIKLRLMHLWK